MDTSSATLWLAKIGSAFEMNDIRGGRVTCYLDDIRPLSAKRSAVHTENSIQLFPVKCHAL